MAPILGIYASQISGHLWAPSGAYDSIATTTVGSGGAASISFTSIPSTYTHLQIRGIFRSNYAGLTDNLDMRWNSDTGSNYAEHIVRGDGSSAGAFGDPSQSTIHATLDGAGNTANANVFAATVMDILDYANTNKYKVMRNLSGRDNNGDGGVSFSSGLWMNTAALTTILLYPRYGSLFQQYSSFALYGIKGA
jgi:hypothetical protein